MGTRNEVTRDPGAIAQADSVGIEKQEKDLAAAGGRYEERSPEPGNDPQGESS